MSYYNIRATYAIFWNFWNMRLFLNYHILSFVMFEEYALSRNMSLTMISEYWTKLISKEILQKKLEELYVDAGENQRGSREFELLPVKQTIEKIKNISATRVKAGGSFYTAIMYCSCFSNGVNTPRFAVSVYDRSVAYPFITNCFSYMIICGLKLMKILILTVLYFDKLKKIDRRM